MRLGSIPVNSVVWCRFFLDTLQASLNLELRAISVLSCCVTILRAGFSPR